MNILKNKSIGWVYGVVLSLLYLASLYWLGYEHLVNPQIEFVILVVNLALISVPLILLYGSIGLILIALRQKEIDGKIGLRLSRFLYYTPRVAGILMIIFVSLFALDVFSMGGNFWQKLFAFLIHAAPSILLAIVMFFAWRKPVVGFIIFGVAAILFLRFVFFGQDFGAGNFMMFVAPLALISAMFWINWKWGDVLQLKVSR